MADAGSIKINVKINRGQKTRERERPENIKVDVALLMRPLADVQADTFENKLIALANGVDEERKAAAADALNEVLFVAFCKKYPDLRLVLLHAMH